MKKIISLCFLLFSLPAFAQKLIKTNLYYCGDTVDVAGCGVFKFSYILLFSKRSEDTIKSFNGNQYGIIVDCPEMYGKNFFLNKQKYKLKIYKPTEADINFCKPQYLEYKKHKIKVYKAKLITKFNSTRIS